MTGSAPGKAILFGEHAVVYGQPAIAVPVQGVTARATIRRLSEGPPGSLRIEAPSIGFAAEFDEDRTDEPLQLAVKLAIRESGSQPQAALELRIESDIPVASGLGSSAAVTVAILRAVAEYFEASLAPQRAAELAYQVEQLHHGTPSGIDNSVIALGQPIYFVRGQDLQPMRVAQPFLLVLADSGKRSPTRELVEAVRQRRSVDPEAMDAAFRSIGEIADRARTAIEGGGLEALGPLMSANQALLQEIGVSSPELERLIAAAHEAGASGAKLSGAGGGGIMIALIDSDRSASLEAALQAAGAVRTIVTEVGR